MYKAILAIFCFLNIYGESTMSANASSQSMQELHKERLGALESQIAFLQPLHKELLSCKILDDKFAYISSQKAVQAYLENNSELNEYLKPLAKQYQYVVACVLALGQGPIIFDGMTDVQNTKQYFDRLVDLLFTLERFYDYMGGIVGYHLTTLKLIQNDVLQNIQIDSAEIDPVPYIDIRQKAKERNAMVKAGLESLETMAEVYVVGGAGDRLGLKDEKTNTPLPVATLKFCGHSLLHSLVRDLEAREFLYYKLTGKRVCVPLLLMTSLEKNNDRHIQAICEREGYFGRPKDSIFRILQPLVPVLTIEGNWAVSGRLDLVLKPGGHGVIWKLARDFGAFDWLHRQNKEFLLVRQINNPVAGLDIGLLALAGYGKSSHKAFGFLSCPRKEGMSEGMNVLRRKTDGQTNVCCISNIEYTEFAQRKKSNPHFADANATCDFPTNTNILYANIADVSQASKEYPIPGLLVNMKHPVETIKDGKTCTLPGARLESTMQNIVDVMTNPVSGDVTPEKLRTFLLLNEREKTISVTKKAFDGNGVSETPEGCFYDLINENLRLLKQVCHFEVPQTVSPQEYAQKGPSAIFLYHPALGPNYDIIGQKIQGGKLHPGAELQIEAQQVSMKNTGIDGSLLVTAHAVCGKIDPVSRLRTYSEDVGSIDFENVEIVNRGIDRAVSSTYWTNSIARHESCRIILEGHSECVAKNVRLVGDMEIRVKDCERAILSQNPDGTIAIKVEPLTNALSWKYGMNEENEIILHR